MGNMILRYIENSASFFFYITEKKLKKMDISMNQERNRIVEGDFIQLKMVHTPSVQWCEPAYPFPNLTDGKFS